MRMLRALSLLLLVIPVVVAAEDPPPVTGASASVWVELAPESEGFKVQFPGEPGSKVEVNKRILGTVRASHHVYETAAEHFAVERHELPRMSRMFAPASLILDKTKDELMKGRQADEISYEKGPDTDHSMRIVIYRSRDGRSPVERSNLYLVGRILYVVTAESGESEEARDVARRFFDSFEILDDK